MSYRRHPKNISGCSVWVVNQIHQLNLKIKSWISERIHWVMTDISTNTDTLCLLTSLLPWITLAHSCLLKKNTRTHTFRTPLMLLYVCELFLFRTELWKPSTLTVLIFQIQVSSYALLQLTTVYLLTFRFKAPPCGHNNNNNNNNSNVILFY